MNEIRFSQPAPITEVQNSEIKKEKKNKKSFFISFLSLLLKIIILLAFIYGGVIGSRYFFGSKAETNTYSSVFLDNDQVYFGKILKNSKNEIVLKEVYYLQAGTDFSPNGSSLQGSNFTLVKLGQELHGPEDVMYINREHVLFYENLRDDSQVVKTIKNHNKK